MSLDLIVILATAKAPNADAWSKALLEEHVPVAFSANVDLKHDTGFIPMRVEGRKSGFYFYPGPYSETAALYPALAKIKLDDPTVYDLNYGAHSDECAAVFFSASVLVSRFNGVAFEPQGGVFMTAEQLRDAGRQCLTLGLK